MGYVSSSKYGSHSTPPKKEVERKTEIDLDEIIKQLFELLKLKKELAAKQKEVEEMDKELREKIDKLPEETKQQLKEILKELFPTEAKDAHK